MFLGAPKAARASFESRDRRHTIEQLTATNLHEPNHHLRQRDKSRLNHSSLGTTRFIKLQDRTKTLLYRLLLLCIYITSGAAVFHVIESSEEEEHNFCHENGDTKVELDMAKKFNVSIKAIRKIVLDLCAQFEASHKCKYSHNDWSYYQSLYFVGSVTTTIGYGHLAPKTQMGRLFLIFYAFFGIPINLLTLQSVGEHINLGFHKLITFTERKIYKTSLVRHEHIKTFVLSIILMILMLPIGGLMYYYSEKEKGWTYLDSVYYSFVAMSTIGFGDLVPNEGKEPKSTYEQVMWFIRLLFLGLGLSLVSSVFTSVSGATKQIRTAYMSRRGSYEINGKRSHKPKTRRSFKQDACVHVKDLLCSGNVERPTNHTSDVYSRFEDSMSTTSLSFNQSLHDDHVNYLDEPASRGRSISMALSHASLGFDHTLDWNTNLPMADHNTACNTLQQNSPSDIEMDTLDKTITMSDDKASNSEDDVRNVTLEVTSSENNDVMKVTSIDNTNEFLDETSSNSNKDFTEMQSMDSNADVICMTSSDSTTDVNKMTSPLDAPRCDVIDMINSNDSMRNGGHSKNTCRDDVISSDHVIDGIKT